jgi:hypothetical protein
VGGSVEPWQGLRRQLVHVAPRGETVPPEALHVVELGDCFLDVPAARARERPDPAADSDTVHAFAGRGDDPGDLAARDHPFRESVGRCSCRLRGRS